MFNLADRIRAKDTYLIKVEEYTKRYYPHNDNPLKNLVGVKVISDMFVTKRIHDMYSSECYKEWYYLQLSDELSYDINDTQRYGFHSIDELKNYLEKNWEKVK